MVVKSKIIESGNTMWLEDEINKFLKDVPVENLVDIKLSIFEGTKSNTPFIATIIYKV